MRLFPHFLPFLPDWLRPSLTIGEQSLQTGARSRGGCTVMCILSILIAPGKKDTNKNWNGLLREFYPKGRNLSRVAHATLKRNLALINARSRKVLNFHSAQESWNFELNSCCTWFDNSSIRFHGTSFLGVIVVVVRTILTTKSILNGFQPQTNAFYISIRGTVFAPGNISRQLFCQSVR